MEKSALVRRASCNSEWLDSLKLSCNSFKESGACCPPPSNLLMVGICHPGFMIPAGVSIGALLRMLMMASLILSQPGNAGCNVVGVSGGSLPYRVCQFLLLSLAPVVLLGIARNVLGGHMYVREAQITTLGDDEEIPLQDRSITGPNSITNGLSLKNIVFKTCASPVQKVRAYHSGDNFYPGPRDFLRAFSTNSLVLVVCSAVLGWGSIEVSTPSIANKLIMPGRGPTCDFSAWDLDGSKMIQGIIMIVLGFVSLYTLITYSCLDRCLEHERRRDNYLPEIIVVPGETDSAQKS